MNKWWVLGLSIGYEHSFVHHLADFIKDWKPVNHVAPTFKDALETQKVCQAVIESSASKNRKDIKAF